MQQEPTRGGRKLDAAIRHFGIGERVRGASAIDVGASTGGFVGVLLANGAAHVTAVDVGHGQLAPELAQDPKVTSLERTDFKTLALAVAQGPFDFFTVDVSFVAARSMLRSLAFRLRAGALGVILVKPQFELPSHLVKDGAVSDPSLRKRALDTFLAKASRLGFAEIGHLDSPVPGGSGTVEILVYLRFEGRPESMPKPGERKPGRPSAGRADSLTSALQWFAVAAPGLEAPLCRELAAVPRIENPRVVEGGVEFSGSLAAGMAANLHSRIATRILLRMGEVRARDFAPLRRGLAKLPWKSFVAPDRALRVEAATSHCRLYHTGALADTVELAIRDRVGKLPHFQPRPAQRGEVASRSEAGEGPDEAPGAEPSTRVLLRGQDDRFTASIDSSGELLHRRGWRLEAGRAPLRETLAAGVLALCDYDPSRPLLDPMCGSGTLVIEAASFAQKLPPGAGRAFAFETWPAHHTRSWNELRAATPVPPPSHGVIFAFDRDRRAIETARKNAVRASLADAIRFAVVPWSQAEVDAEPGLLVCNPPYGHRLGERRQSTQLARCLGERLRACFRGWRAGILCPDPAFVAIVSKSVRKQPLASHPLRNGGLRVVLAIWDL
jgi:putative N6-adenine-specific DNA methylase